MKKAKLDKDKFDVSVAKFFYANNISFNCVDSVTFKSLVNDLHPGYKPPNRKRLAGELLDTVCAELEREAKKATNGSMATFCLDGWSNVAKDPIIASSIQVSNKVYIVDIIDTNDEKQAQEDFVLFIGGENVKFYDEIKQIGDVNITNFVKAQVLLGNLSEKLGNISEQLMAMVPSSAGLERIFSSMGSFHSEVRNRIDPEKVR